MNKVNPWKHERIERKVSAVQVRELSWMVGMEGHQPLREPRYRVFVKADDHWYFIIGDIKNPVEAGASAGRLLGQKLMSGSLFPSAPEGKLLWEEALV